MLSSSEIDFASPVIDVASSEIDYSSPVIEAASTEIEAAYTEIEAAYTEIEAASTEIDVASSVIHVASTVIEVASTEIEVASTEIDVASTEMEVASTEIDVASTELEVASPELEVASPELEVASPELEVASTEIEVASTELEVASTVIDVSSTVIDVTSTAIDVASTSIAFIQKEKEKEEDRKIGRVFDELSSVLYKIGDGIEFSLPEDFLKGGEDYIPIKRNIYLNKRRFEDDGIFCKCAPQNGSSSSCDGDCHCAMLFSCCSFNCKCGPTCNNKSFQQRPVKKLKVTKTEKCGFGLVAEEDIQQGEFIIEYVGEVIDDRTCEERLWKMKGRRETNFYLCEVNSNMVIDATNKGNKSRFINHSCDPNTEMQKWRVDGETRVGIFALRDIKRGEDVTYDYMFVQYGVDQVCHCGSTHCKEKLGADMMLLKRKKAKSKDCIQKLVRVWRSQYRMYMEGFIFSYDAKTHLHTIMFVDRSKEEMDLSKEENWTFLPQVNIFKK